MAVMFHARLFFDGGVFFLFGDDSVEVPQWSRETILLSARQSAAIVAARSESDGHGELLVCDVEPPNAESMTCQSLHLEVACSRLDLELTGSERLLSFPVTNGLCNVKLWFRGPENSPDLVVVQLPQLESGNYQVSLNRAVLDEADGKLLSSYGSS